MYIDPGPPSAKTPRKRAEPQIEMAPVRWHFRKWMPEFRDDSTRIAWIELSKFHGVFDEATRNDDINVGDQVATGYWSRGFAFEAAQPVLHYAFNTLELDRLVALARPDSPRAGRLLERLNFRRLPTRRHQDEGEHQCFLYALPKGDSQKWKLFQNQILKSTHWPLLTYA